MTKWEFKRDTTLSSQLIPNYTPTIKYKINILFNSQLKAVCQSFPNIMERQNFGWHSKDEPRYFEKRGRGRGHGRGYQGRGYGWRNRAAQQRGFSHYRGSEENGGQYSSQASSRGRTSSPYERSRHPSGLRGREIGLWYAKRGRVNSNVKLEVPTLSMDEDEAHFINKAIDGLKSPHQRLGDDSRKSWKPRSTFCSPSACTNSQQTAAPPVTVKQEEDMDVFDNPEAFIQKNDQKQRNAPEISGLLDQIEESEFKDAYRANIEGNKLRDVLGFSEVQGIAPSRLVKNTQLDESLYEELLEKENNSLYQKMLKVRQKLPSYQRKQEILDLIQDNQVVVLSGETGCGKTTQVGQFLLDDRIRAREGSTCRIVCTQPRRISAISVAERVAEERGERLGLGVGYQIRLETVLPRNQGSLLYCTTGIILQWLQSDPLLASVSHLILDEVHERDTTSDFLICIARDLLPLRPDLKLVLMSATLNAEHFSKYYGDCPMIHIPGFTYPVKEYFLEDVLKFTSFVFPTKQPRYKKDSEPNDFEDYILPHVRKLENEGGYPKAVIQELQKENSEELNLDLALELLKYIAGEPPGAVLVFMPGWGQISNLHKMMQNDQFFNSRDFLVIPLHSLMPTVNQREVFNRPPEGVRKIIIATNIAETSITIDDIVYVVDGGRIKMKKYDRKTNITTLLAEWVSLANAKQRRGRAGRVQEGVCYHLYTRAREMRLESFPLPEIQRTRLEGVILEVKALRLGYCKPFLQKLLDSPDESVIDVSIKMLLAINALDEEENLTPLGLHLAHLPMDPLTGKMVLMAAIFSCVSPVLTVAASLAFKDPFIMVLGKEKLVDACRRSHAGNTRSDHLMVSRVFNKWMKSHGAEANRFVWNNFLSLPILKQLADMRLQLLGMLKDAKFVNTKDPEAPELNRNSDNLSLVKAVITAGLYPNVARIVKKRRGKWVGLATGLSLPDVGKAAFHLKSVNEKERSFDNSWVVYWEKYKSSKVFLYDTTMISNYPLLLFGQKLDYNPKKKIISVDDFVQIRSDQNVADTIQKLRRELDELLEYKISHPGATNWSSGSKEGRLLTLIVDIISKEKDTSEDFVEYGTDNGEEND